MRRLISNFKNKRILILLFILVLSGTLALLYFGSRPERYDLTINTVSPYDIEAPRSVVDKNSSHQRALDAKAHVPDVFSRSEENSLKSLNRVENFLKIISKERDKLYKLSGGLDSRPEQADLDEASNSLKIVIKAQTRVDISELEAKRILNMSQNRYLSFENRIRDVAEAVMAGSVPSSNLSNDINKHYELLQASDETYSNDASLIRTLLERVLRTNMVYNAEASNNARQEAYDRIMQNPIMINRGTRILSAGEVVTEEIYAILKDLGMVEANSVSWPVLGGQFILVFIVLMIMVLYLNEHSPYLLGLNRKTAALLSAYFIPIIIAAYFGQDLQLVPPVYFTAVVLSAYFGYTTAVVVTMAQIVITLPLVNFNPAYVIVAICGSLIAAHYTRDLKSQATLAKLIIIIGLINFLSSLAYTLMQGGSFSGSGVYMITSVISAVLSVVGAIGLMPLFEMVFDIVSPSSLIELSQPGHPLLRRLFLEAPGTSQHSMMVANLADAGAEAIGADALICRVGSYYHDIGKLNNPLYFTENQFDYNPHDDLAPEVSRDIIFAHTRDGVELGKKYNLPKPLLDMMVEHHGTTVLAYFYNKAKAIAEEEGLEPPNPDDYRYKGPLPQTPESAVVMFADSTEAAVKSLEFSSLEQVEERIRSVFRIKLDQDQLTDSGLGFADIEKIIQAFLQVYAGHFHERITYPDAPKVENYDG